MDTLSAIVAILKELGTPAITVIGFAWVIFKLNASKKDMSELDARFTSSISALRTELKADISALEAKLTALDGRLTSSISALDAKLTSSISALDAKLTSRITELDGRLTSSITAIDGRLTSSISALRADVQSIKGNHLPHIEAAIKALAKGTPNEENVKAILDVSREVELRMDDIEQEINKK
jgi:CII-binding regulator of phage lambda lysogenization HflD